MSEVDTLQILKALANEARWKIILMLSDPKAFFPNKGNDDVCLGLIAKTLGLSQSTVSSYMSKLEQAKLVISQRSGQWTFYRLNPETISAMSKKLKQLI